MNLRIKVLSLILAFSGLGLGASFAKDKVWVGLFFAKNSPPAPEVQLAPEPLALQLRDVFGFKNYELIKSGEIELGHEWQQWVVPRNDFFLRVEPLHHHPGEPKMVYYEIYKDGFLIARGTYEPHEDIPLFINGPDFKQGRFIFVLDTQ